jgi:aminopeptidase N
MRARVICLVLTAIFLTIPFSSSARISPAQYDESVFERIRREHESIEKSHHAPAAVAAAPYVSMGTAAQPVDVKHYRLQIQLTSQPAGISGTVTIEGETLSAVGAINVDAQSNLIIDGVRLDGAPRNFQRTSSQVTLNFPDAAAGRKFTAAIEYHGNPIVSNLLGGGLLVSNHGPDGATVMASLSEPFAAPTWWPCIDNAQDKATAEIEITVPRGFQAASNGTLVKEEAGPGRTTTYYWREDYPIATYLISVAATNYVKFEDTYKALDGETTMPLVYYAYPEHIDLARLKFGVTRRAIEIFAPLFGEYPFLSEKYGMAEFPWGGAMEHQTITSMGAGIVGSLSNGGQAVIAHELAHHWWGDQVTMKTWNDIWLNEGFATYSEVLFLERFANLNAGDLMARSYDDGEVSGQLGGTVNAENPDNPFDDRGAIYSKGAWVLHMLRHLLGDAEFFAALKDYREQFAYGNASTRDFQRVCESHYGGPLDWFFQQWVYARRRPLYKVSSGISKADSAGDYVVSLSIKQKQSHEIPGREQSVYVMPLDVMIHYADGSRETRVILNDARKQKFSFTVSKQPEAVGIDEDNWVLKKVK